MLKQQYKMRQKMNAYQMYQYLSQKNFNLSSDKTLKEPQANPDVIWNILVFLVSNIKDTKFQQIQPALSYLMDPQIHKQSLKRIKEYTNLSDTLKKIIKNNQQFPIRQILKPERESLYQRISLLINANKFVQKVLRQQQPKRMEIKLKKQLVTDLRHKLQSRLQQIQEMKSIKQKQRLQYQQKIQSIQNLNKQLNYKKKQKLDLLNSQQLLDNELKKKIKTLNQISYQNDDLNIKIKQLQRQVIRNAPKLKKQRFALIDDYENLLKKAKQQYDIWSTKNSSFWQKLKPINGLKQKSKTFRIQQKLKQAYKSIQQINFQKQTLSNDQAQKSYSNNSKKQLLKWMQEMQKEKKQVSQQMGKQEKQYSLLQKSFLLIKEEERVILNNVKALEQKNLQSINQHKALYDKTRLKRQKLRQKMIQLSIRLAAISDQANSIINDTFSDFN